MEPTTLAPESQVPIETLVESQVPTQTQPELAFDLCVCMDQHGIIAVKEYGLVTNPWLLAIAPLINSVASSGSRIIIMGYRTWASMTVPFRSNPQRYCIVITSDPSVSIEHGCTAPDLDSALTHAVTHRQTNDTPILVLASPSLTPHALSHSNLKHIRVACMPVPYPNSICDVERCYFPIKPSCMDKHLSCIALSAAGTIYACGPEFSSSWNRLADSKSVLNHPSNDTPLPEQQYLDLVKLIVDKGTLKVSRNGSTRSIWGHQLRFDLSEGYPLLTVKRGYPKAVFEELMWMLRGQTDTRILRSKGIKIWDGNSSEAFLRERGLPYSEGDIGPGYGFQIRHTGATYINCETNYQGQGRDQLADCITLLNSNPTSRRIIIDLWNARDVDLMALPPCHMVYNFGVDLYDKPEADHNASCMDTPKPNGSRGVLNCHLFQRSWDVLLGWNTTTAALLTYLLAHHCNLDPGSLIHSISDAHLYQSHIDSGAIASLLERKPRPPPILSFKTRHENIEAYEFGDMTLTGYYPAPAIVAEMVA